MLCTIKKDLLWLQQIVYFKYNKKFLELNHYLGYMKMKLDSYF